MFLNHLLRYRGHIAVYGDSYYPTSGLRIDRVNLYLC